MSILNHSIVVGWKIRHLSGLVKKTAGQTCLLLRAAIHSQRTLQTFPPLLSKRLRNFEKQGGKSGFSQRFSQQQRSPVSFLGSFWWQQRAVIPTLHVRAHCKTLWAHSCTAAQYVMCAVQNAFKHLHCGQLLLTHSWKCTAARTCNRFRKHSTQHWWH